MMHKLWKRLTNNFSLKIISVVFACVLWLVVVNIDNPSATRTFKAMAEITNENIITDNKNVFEVLDDSQMITFTVTGPRSIVERLTSADFKAVADMSKIKLEFGLVPIDVTANRYESQLSIGVKIPNLHVKIQKLKEQQFVITVNSTGTPLSEYAKGEILVQPNVVQISGPESVVKRIKKVVATINLEGAYMDKTESVIPLLYDEMGKQIDMTNILMSPNAVTLRAEILETKNLSVVIQSSGVVADGYSFEGLEYTPSTIEVKGTREELSAISEILVPATEVDLSQAKADIKKVINISQYLSEGIELVDPELSTVIVTAKVIPLETKVFDLETKNIMLLNLNPLYQFKFDEQIVKITVKGKKAVITPFDLSSVVAQLDLAGTSKGIVRVNLTLKLPEGITQEGVIKISGVLTEATDSGGRPGN
jgi:YbbR domain-containing protein